MSREIILRDEATGDTVDRIKVDVETNGYVFLYRYVRIGDDTQGELIYLRPEEVKILKEAL